MKYFFCEIQLQFVVHLFTIACSKMMRYTIYEIDGEIFKTIALPSQSTLNIAAFSNVFDNFVDHTALIAEGRTVPTFCWFIIYRCLRCALG